MSKEVKRRDELKLLAEAAKAAQETYLSSDSEQAYDAWAHLDDQFNEKATPATVLELLAERDALLAERDRLKEALERFYNANQTRLKLLSRDVYLDMQRLPGMRDALYEMDDAQHQAFAALQGEQP